MPAGLEKQGCLQDRLAGIAPVGTGGVWGREWRYPRASQLKLGLLLLSVAQRSGLWAPSPFLDGMGQVIMVPVPGTRKTAPGSTSVPHALPNLTRNSHTQGLHQGKGRGARGKRGPPWKAPVHCWPQRALLGGEAAPGALLGLPKGSRGIQHAAHGSPSQAQGRLSQCALLESHHMGAGWLQGVELELP